MVDEDNRKSAVIWSVVEIAFWVFCLILSINDEQFENCRSLYIAALALTIITLVLSAVVVPKKPGLIRPLIAMMHFVLLGAGIGLAFFQPNVRSATFIASVLIVPVMFVWDTLPTLACVALGIAVFAIAGPGIIAPDVFDWTLKSLVIFSFAGVLIGHIINKTRYERYEFAESALELAELRNKYAYYDQLTELRNRHAYTEEIERLAADASSPYCIVMADINGLKRVNDAYGHSAGDELIVGAAECLKQSFENVGEVYRLGGDEFCVITTVSAEEAAERLQRMEQMAANWKGRFINGISISYGIASRQEGANINSVLEAADQKMYEYKRRYYAVPGRERRLRPALS